MCSDLWPSYPPLFLVPWPGPTPREQQFARQQGTKPEEEAVGGAKIGRSAARTPQDQELLS